MIVKSVFVTGANRGIGLEFVKQLVNLPIPPKYVFATYRNENQALEEIKDAKHDSKLILIQMDVTIEAEVKAAARVVESTVGEEGLNLLINNAGRAAIIGFPNLTTENLHQHFETNTVGPIMLFQALLPSLQKASRSHACLGMSVSRAAVLNISSMAGSIQDVSTRPKDWLMVFGYRTSKAALNMAMRVAAGVVKDDRILVLIMCPGLVKTDMGGHDRGEITVQDSVSTMLDTISRMNESNHGEFCDRFGTVIPF